MSRDSFPLYMASNPADSGPACLQMITMFFGKAFNLQFLRERSVSGAEESDLKGISDCAEGLGMRTVGAQLAYESKDRYEMSSLLEVSLPCIIRWQSGTYAVVYRANRRKVWIADPLRGKQSYRRAEFEQAWANQRGVGQILLVEPSPDFYAEEEKPTNKSGFSYLFAYLRSYRKLIVQLVLGLILGSLFQLLLPFLTQAVVDVGIENQNINFIYLILLAQLMLFIGQTSVTFIQTWILLHIGSRINVALISDFLISLMKLPIGFFSTRKTGDLLQRIGDQARIERFLTGSTFTILLSFFNLIIFGVVLLMYNLTIFFIFAVGSFLYVFWIFFFLKRRAEVDHMRFKELAENQSTLIELIQGMQEIKLQNSERKRRRKWTIVQARLFKANIKSLTISQYQDVGTSFINQLKDILIVFVAAKAVIDGEMTLGMMLATQYIVGQLNGPLGQAVDFIRAAQDASISLSRLGEIHEQQPEIQESETIDMLPEKGDIIIEQVNYRYEEDAPLVLQDVSLTIPHGKVTAIVGTSGSGKTTLVKLLLGFFRPTSGNIRVGGVQFNNIRKRLWREKCGAVMQDGYIFSDTIANNITESSDWINRNRLIKSVRIANIVEFIKSLPLGFNTKIGAKGNGISQGQKQRLLIARAVYKEPRVLFFDEATNALDARNERVIVEQLEQFFEGRTVIVVAHRLSTVRNADQIVVLDKGQIVEIGRHEELVEQKGAYFELIKNQLELGT
ncbi:MAG: peptidase domain-containing ABC transporter [Bacteroidota bacterium]